MLLRTTPISRARSTRVLTLAVRPVDVAYCVHIDEAWVNILSRNVISLATGKSNMATLAAFFEGRSLALADMTSTLWTCSCLLSDILA
uniref:Transposase n=2 Tax=Panagrellus redivivus TaxID=6233 RepID=A0A7E4V3X8_PANRE